MAMFMFMLVKVKIPIWEADRAAGRAVVSKDAAMRAAGKAEAQVVARAGKIKERPQVKVQKT